MLSVIRDPALFYQEQATDRLSGPILTVLIAAVTNVLATVILLASSWSTIAEASTYVTTAYVLSIFFGIGSVVGSWVLYSAAFHAVSAVFGGEGSFRRTLTYTGWGFVPIAVSGLIHAGLIFLRVREAIFPDSAQQLGPFVQQLTSGPLFTMASLLGIVFTIWSGVIWTFAMRDARALSLRYAAATVALPLGIWITWRLYSVLSPLL
ncbi:Yip1 family protein [Halapricum desulfuricans]|uniref:Putative conserved membrane protein, Yip1family n=1 Tax=Halapricum desulfuricans TaxID=2841257 RepID=A0A897NTU6_9EURY|nr:YIP1 family protein [Halapricum desulfuricans]QSG13586.1 putative conserved membrane protein, Yip1family [Halapricum desulfuricans]